MLIENIYDTITLQLVYLAQNENITTTYYATVSTGPAYKGYEANAELMLKATAEKS